MSTIKFTNGELKTLILSLNPHKSQECDNISIQMLQLCVETIHISLGIIFKSIIKNGHFSDQWKIANVTPIQEKG